MLRCAIVDDDAMCRLALKRLIQLHSEIHLSAVCKSGQDLLDILESNAVDLVFLDMNMPDFRGEEVLDKIPPYLPVVITTGEDEMEMSNLPETVIYLIHKPVSVAEFQCALDRVPEKWEG
ncbi:MAG: response regulator [Bacteroidota bacterium]